MRKIDIFHYISISSIACISFIVYFNLIPQNIILALKDVFIALNVLAILFALFFARSKVFVLLLIPLFFSLYMFYPTFLGLDGGKISFWHIFPITTTFGFLFIGILQERGLFCFYGLSKIIIIFTLFAITYYLLNTFSIELKNALDTKIISYDLPSFIKVNNFTFITSMLSIVFVSIISTVFFVNSIEKAPFWLLLSLLIPSFFVQTEATFILFSTLGSILCIVALLKDTYHMAYIDALTKIPGRRALEENFLKLGATYSIAMIDIDFFKKFNDEHGHNVGDEVLNLVAELLNSVSGGGRVYRYGGEEFTIIFANKTSKEILPYLEDIRAVIDKRDFILRSKNRTVKDPQKISNPKNSKALHVSVSIGVASAPKDGKTPQEIMKKADIILYKAKKAGRNCIMTS